MIFSLIWWAYYIKKCIVMIYTCNNIKIIHGSYIIFKPKCILIMYEIMYESCLCKMHFELSKNKFFFF